MLRQLILVRFKVIQRAAVMYTRVPIRVWIYVYIDRLVKGTLSRMLLLQTETRSHLLWVLSVVY